MRHIDGVEIDEPLSSGKSISNTSKISKVCTHSRPVDDSSLHPGHFKRKKMPLPVWFDDPKDLDKIREAKIELSERLTKEIDCFVKYTNAEIEVAQLSVHDSIARLNSCVGKLWPSAHATCFGSFASGLWLPSSDVDVVIQGIPSFVVETNPRKAPIDILLERLQSESWISSANVAGTKVLVIKVILKACGRRMDIVIESSDTQHGRDATEILRSAVISMPNMRPLVLVLKAFLREKSLNNAFTGGLSSYSLVLLCMHFILQHPPCDVGSLVLGFLEYYGTIYDHRRTGITWLINPLGHLESVEYEVKGMTSKCNLVLDDPIKPDQRGVYNVGAGSYSMARVVSVIEDGYYAIKFHRPSRFTPTLLSELIHWSGMTSIA